MNDPSAIRDAQDEVDNAIFEQKIRELEKQKDAIQLLIDALEEYKQQWIEIKDIWEDMKNEMLADSILGEGWKDLILAMDPNIYENFKNDYVEVARLADENEIFAAKADYSDILGSIQGAADQICGAINGLKETFTEVSGYEIKDQKTGKTIGLYDSYEEAARRLGTITDHYAGMSELSINEVSYEDAEKLALAMADVNTFWDNALRTSKNYNDETKKSIAEEEKRKQSIHFTEEELKKMEDDMNRLVETSSSVSEMFDNMIDSKMPEEQYYRNGFSFSIDYDKDQREYLEEIKDSFPEIIIPAMVELYGVEETEQTLSSLNSEEFEAKLIEIYTETDNAEERISLLQEYLDSLHDKVVNVTVNTSLNAEAIKAEAEELARKATMTVQQAFQNDVGKKPVHMVKASGTVSNGNAYANGKYTADFDGQALVGELGQELRVRDGRFSLIGKRGAEFTDVQKDDIIFNASQTKAILKYGHINSRGHAFADGTGITPLALSDPDRLAMLNSFIPKIHNNTDIMKVSILNIDSSIKELTGKISSANMVYTPTEQTPIINISNPTFQCTGVTGEEVLHQIEHQFEGMFLNAYQQSMKR